VLNQLLRPKKLIFAVSNLSTKNSRPNFRPTNNSSINCRLRILSLKLCSKKTKNNRSWIFKLKLQRSKFKKKRNKNNHKSNILFITLFAHLLLQRWSWLINRGSSYTISSETRRSRLLSNMLAHEMDLLKKHSILKVTTKALLSPCSRCQQVILSEDSLLLSGHLLVVIPHVN